MRLFQQIIIFTLLTVTAARMHIPKRKVSARTRRTQVVNKAVKKDPNKEPLLCKQIDYSTIFHGDALDDPRLDKCRDYWLATSPSVSPSHSSSPSTLSESPSLKPSVTPTVVLSNHPSISPSAYPSMEASMVPTNEPTAQPTISHKPTFISTVTVPMPQFTMDLTFDVYNNVRRLLSKRELNESLVTTEKLEDFIFIILSSAFEQNYEDFYALNLRLIYLATTVDDVLQTTTVSYWFSGSIILETKGNGLIDASAIPSESDLQRQTLQAFSNYEGSGLSDATHGSFKSWVISKVGDSDFDSNFSENTDIKEVTGGGIGTIPITVTASIVAIISTATAFFLIYKHNRVNKSANEELEPNTPQKQSSKDDFNVTGRKFRSPFLNVTPTDGPRKYFSKLDDESVNSKNFGSMLNPEQSLVDSSFDESSFGGSLMAPSIATSKLGEQSVEQSVDETLAGMSALDDVRLNNVLQIEDDGDSIKSIASNSTGAFRRIWYGNKQKQKRERNVKKLSPSSKDTPIKSSPSKPVKSKQSEDVRALKSDVDDASLLGDQSIKGEYYTANEDSNLFYNMLGDRSVVSETSEDFNFNEMYNGDGVASSSCTSEQCSDLDGMSRGSHSQT